MKTKKTITNEQIQDMYLNRGMTHSDIAREANVSRERIRQIINNLNLPTGRQMLATKRKLKEQRRQEARIKRQEQIAKNRSEKEASLKDKYQPVQDLWQAGRSLKEIESITGINKGSLSWIIGTMREKYGWFEKRRPNYKRK